MEGYYYLHENGDLIFKKEEPGDSPFVRKVWYIDTTDRATAWILCLEALSLNAHVPRIQNLSEKWGLTAEDSLDFLANEESSEERKKQIILFMEKIYGLSEDEYFARLDEEAEKRNDAKGVIKSEIENK